MRLEKCFAEFQHNLMKYLAICTDNQQLVLLIVALLAFSVKFCVVYISFFHDILSNESICKLLNILKILNCSYHYLAINWIFFVLIHSYNIIIRQHVG